MTPDPGAGGPQHDRGDVVPLTAGQRRLAMADLPPLESPAHHVAVRIRLLGTLEVTTLERSVAAVTDRHDALRARFVRDEVGAPVQVVGAADPRPLPPETADDPDAWARERARQPLDLAAGPPARWSLLRVDDREHHLLLVAHALVLDGWSLGVLVREVLGGLDGDRPSGPATGYRDAVAAAAADPADRDADLDHWRTVLADPPARLSVPDVARHDAGAGEDLRPAAGAHARTPAHEVGGARTVHLDARVTGELRDLARARRATTSTVLLAAVAAVLHRATGRTDLLLGTAAAGRMASELSDQVGAFATTLPLRIDLTGAPSFGELVDRVRAVTLGAVEHQYAGFDEIVAACPDLPARPLGVTVTTEDAHPGELEVGDLRAELTEIGTGHVAEDLAVVVHPRGEGLDVTLRHRAAACSGSTAATLLDRIAVLARVAAAAPEVPIGDLVVVDPPRQRELVSRWNRTDSPFPDDVGVHELVERQVDASPEAEAVVHDDGTARTYRELDERANQLAHHLRATGVTRGATVALQLDRGPDLVVAILGVLKAGAAYVPLDPTYPQERRAFMVSDAGCVALVTQDDHAEAWSDAGPTVLRLDGDRAALDARPTHRPEPVAGPRDLAYVIYTSGSTGRPKGVMIEHRSVCNFVTSVHGMFGMGPDDTVLQFASPGFDVSVFETFSALTCGARLATASQDTLHSLDDLAAHLRRTRVSIMDMPPAVMALLDGGDFPDLRVAFVGGEAFSGDLVERWTAPGRLFVNGYGPTEGTVTVIAEESTGTTSGEVPPIGRPMPNMRAHVLDDGRDPVPVGVPGELCLSGVGLARGYLGRPDLTERVFVPDPFDDTPGARLYRTGDLVRQLPDGRLVFQGRVDDQVKLRGFRIELGEVETALRSCPGVSDAAVMLREDQPGDRRLVGYVVGDPATSEPDVADLRARLGTTLPEHMVPAAIVPLDRLPLSPSGKVDRGELPAPAREERTADDDARLPRTEDEQAVAAAWCRVLEVETVRATDDFADLGGESLDAMRVARDLAAGLEVRITVRDVFDHPTVADLAGLVEHRRSEDAAEAVT